MNKRAALIGSIYTMTTFPSAPLMADSPGILNPANTTPVFTTATTPPIAVPVSSAQQTDQAAQLSMATWWQKLQAWAKANPLPAGAIAAAVVVGGVYFFSDRKKR